MSKTRFLFKSVIFWFVLLVIALLNAVIRETTYKPLLTPMIGMWAHQLSSVTGILLFFGTIYFYLKKSYGNYSQSDLITIGVLWIVMTMIFESAMNGFVRKLSFAEIMQTYYFWKGETWIFVLLSLGISPQIAYRILKNNREK